MVWSSWHQFLPGDRGDVLILSLRAGETISYVTGYSKDNDGTVVSLCARTSLGRSWGPHGDHQARAGSRSLRESPRSKGLSLGYLSGRETGGARRIAFHWRAGTTG